MHDFPQLDSNILYTIGHADHSLATFLSLLTDAQVQVLIDVRSHEYAESHPLFTPAELQSILERCGIAYRCFGEALPRDVVSQSVNEPRMDYTVLDKKPCLREDRPSALLEGVKHLAQGIHFGRIALMCGEENPISCVRVKVMRSLLSLHKIVMRHIRGDGRIQTNDELDQEKQDYLSPVQNQIIIHSIGFTNYTAERFFQTLRQEGIKKLMDIRLNNWSQFAGFTKRDDFPYFLRELCGIEYVHELLLAPTREILDSYKKHKGTWQNYERAFLALLSEREVEKTLSPNIFNTPTVILCYEPTADFCHRRLVLEYLQQKWGNVNAIHL